MTVRVECAGCGEAAVACAETEDKCRGLLGRLGVFFCRWWFCPDCR